MENVLEAPVKFTESAVNEIKKLMEQEGFDSNKKMRVGVKGGGCSGMTYLLEFDEAKDNDVTFNIGGVACVIDKSHNIYLAGMTVNWEGGLNSRGFTFVNPNASSTCGCGTSFAV